MDTVPLAIDYTQIFWRNNVIHTHTQNQITSYIQLVQNVHFVVFKRNLQLQTKKAKLKTEINKTKNTKNTNNWYIAGKEKEASSR